jgi:hypothetical protein
MVRGSCLCGRCGSPLFKRVTGKQGDEIRLRLGCLDSDIEERSLGHVFVSEKPNWAKIDDELPQFDRMPTTTPK